MNTLSLLVPLPARARAGHTTRTCPRAVRLRVSGLEGTEAKRFERFCRIVLRDWLGKRDGGTLSVTIRVDPRAAFKEVPSRPAAIAEQAYRLVVGRNATLTARAAAGARHGLQTLRQLLESGSDSGRLPHCRIEDWPRIAHRGIHVDVARETEYRPGFFRKIVERCAYFKLNQLHLYLENRFAFSSCPEVVGVGAVTVAQARALRDYASLFGITVVPQIETMGHMAGFLHGPYAEMREHADHAANICPSHPRARPFLAGMIADVAEAFRPPFIHVGYDESHSGTCARCREKGTPQAILGEHLRWLHREVTGHGARTMIYGDKFLPRDELPLLCGAHGGTGREAREAIRRVPRDVIVTNWHYVSPHAGSVRWLRREGFREIYCTTASNLFISNAIPLLRGARWIAETMKRDLGDGAVGSINCNWEIFRGQALDNAWVLNALAAERGWSAQPHDAVAWTRRFSSRFYGAGDDAFGHILGLAEVIPTDRCDQFLDSPVLAADVKRPLAPAPWGWVGWDHPETGADLIARARAYRRRVKRNADTLRALDMPGEVIRYIGLRVRCARLVQDALIAKRKTDALRALRVAADAAAGLAGRLDRLYRIYGSAVRDRPRVQRHREGLARAMATVRATPARRLDTLTMEELIKLSS